MPRALPVVGRWMNTLGIGTPPSSFIRTITALMLPISMVIAATHMMYGHDQPGDGFTAGVIVSLVVGLWYVIFGYEETRQRLSWLRPGILIPSGLLLALFTGAVGGIINGALFSPVDLGEMVGLALPKGFHISTAFLFEVAVFLSVLGSASLMINTLGHPGETGVNDIPQIGGVSEAEGV